jgi:hypothetical protein
MRNFGALHPSGAVARRRAGRERSGVRSRECELRIVGRASPGMQPCADIDHSAADSGRRRYRSLRWCYAQRKISMQIKPGLTPAKRPARGSSGGANNALGRSASDPTTRHGSLTFGEPVELVFLQPHCTFAEST